MTDADQIKFAIREIVKNDDEVYAIAGNVLAVDKDANTCDVDPLDDSAQLLGIDLKADSGAGIVVYPKIGSLVYVIMTSQSTGFVGMFSEIDIMTMKSGGESLKDILLGYSKAIQSLILTTNQGPTIDVVNKVDFIEIDKKVKKFFNE